MVVPAAAPANADADAETGSTVGRFTPMTVGFVDDGKGLGHSPYSITDLHVDDQVGLAGLQRMDIHFFRNIGDFGIQTRRFDVIRNHARYVDADDAVAAQGNLFRIDDDFDFVHEFFRIAVDKGRIIAGLQFPGTAFILGDEIVAHEDVRCRIIGLYMIDVIADEVLIDAEIVAANESRRLGRQILQQSRDLIVGTPFQDVKVIEVLDIDRRVCQDDGCPLPVCP